MTDQTKTPLLSEETMRELATSMPTPPYGIGSRPNDVVAFGRLVESAVLQALAAQPADALGASASPTACSFGAKDEELCDFLASIADNLGDMPISDAYAERQSRKAEELLERFSAREREPGAEGTRPAPGGEALTDAMAWRKAVQEAYGWLWHVNNEPAALVPLWPPEKAAYEARKCLRELLTSAERVEAINAVAGLLDNNARAALTQEGSGEA